MTTDYTINGGTPRNYVCLPPFTGDSILLPRYTKGYAVRQLHSTDKAINSFLAGQPDSPKPLLLYILLGVDGI